MQKTYKLNNTRRQYDVNMLPIEFFRTNRQIVFGQYTMLFNKLPDDEDVVYEAMEKNVKTTMIGLYELYINEMT